ncbi:MAG: hypothetical protein ACFFF9_16850 [Candidatus Thorarchaeota archaeon]
MRSLGYGELRLLRRLVIDPSLRQAGLAQELDVTRSAINQIWHKLETDFDTAVRSNLDFGKLGLQLVFGWAYDREGSDVLSKFSRWLHSNRFVCRLTKSVMSSTMDARIYFEAIVPTDKQFSWFQNQMQRFRKKPYSLDLNYEIVTSVANHMNLGLFNGSEWGFNNDFRLEASIGAARNYVDVLPVVDTMVQSETRTIDLQNLAIAAGLESNYHITATEMKKKLEELGIGGLASRTLRRKLASFRKTLAKPYVDITNIGLNRKLMVCLKDENPSGSTITKLLHAQASTFPKARVISGSHMTVIDLETPETVDWVTMSQIFAGMTDNTSEICTFIANDHEIDKRLESIVHNIASRNTSQ